MMSSVNDRDLRKAKRDLNVAIKDWNGLVSCERFSKEDLRNCKEAVDKVFFKFATVTEDLIKSESNEDDVEELKESLEMFVQLRQSIEREYESLKSDNFLDDVKALLEVQNQEVSDKFNALGERLSSLERKASQKDLSHSDKSLFASSNVVKDSLQPSTSAKLNPSAAKFVPDAGVSFSREVKENSSANQCLDVAGFILRHGLMNDRKFKFDGNPMDYVEFFRHFNSCYLKKISDPDILVSCLLDMLTGKALQSVKGFRQLPSDVALQKILDTLKSRFGNPEQVREAQRNHILSQKKLKDDVNSLSEFLANLNNFKVMNDYLECDNSVSASFMSSVINCLPFRLREMFLDKLAEQIC